MRKYKITAGILAGILLFACGCAKESDDRPGTVTDLQVPTVTDAEKSENPYPARIESIFASTPDTAATDFTYTETQEGAMIVAYHGSDAVVRVPASIDGKPVVGIGAEAFAEKDTLTALYLPVSVQTVEAGALAACNSLRTLMIPRLYGGADGNRFLGYLFGAADYGDHALYVPSSLEYLLLYAETEVPAYAFCDANDLVCVSLGEGVTAIGDFAFYNCKAMQYCAIGGSVKTIGAYAFAGSGITEMAIPQSVTAMGRGLFEDCAAIAALSLPFVGDGGENGFLGYLFGAASYVFTAGYMPTSLVEVTVLSGCDTIENHAFYDCASLQSISLPDTVKAIGLRAFYGCKRLCAIRIPDACERIGDLAFMGCVNLKTLTFGAQSALTEIGMQAFYGCVGLETLACPPSLARIGASAFAKCGALQTVIFPANGGVQIEKDAFLGCDRISRVENADGVVFADGNQSVTDRP